MVATNYAAISKRYAEQVVAGEILACRWVQRACQRQLDDLAKFKGKASPYLFNPKLKDTQFADYHGHGWNFRGIFKRDREGNLLTADGNMSTYGTDTANIIDPKDPEKWRKSCSHYSDPKERDLCLSSADPGKPGVEGKFVPPGINPGKAVHMMDIHAEKGMQCADCHFEQDSHGNGLIYGEVANAIEITCKDCHGTPDAYPTLRTSGPAAPPEGHDLSLLRNPDGKRRFEWMEGADGRRKLIQRSIVDPSLEWEMSLVKDSVDPATPVFNAKAARAKLVSRYGAETSNFEFGTGIAEGDRAHRDPEMACFTCHLSWTTSCGGCHLPIEANWKTKIHKYEGGETRNFATYNPQVARDEMFQLGKHQTTKGNQVAPVRSSSALVLSSTNINRERIYVQQPPIAASGFSSQAFAPHFPHTVRLTETKTCTDCHLSAKDDNNAIMAQLLLQRFDLALLVEHGAVQRVQHVVHQRDAGFEVVQAVGHVGVSGECCRASAQATCSRTTGEAWSARACSAIITPEIAAKKFRRGLLLFTTYECRQIHAYLRSNPSKRIERQRQQMLNG